MPSTVKSNSIIGGEHEVVGSHVLATLDPARLTRGMTGAWSISGRAAFGLILKDLKKKGVKLFQGGHSRAFSRHHRRIR